MLRTDKKYVTNFEIWVHGKLDGRAKISNTEFGDGPVRVKLYDYDHYADSTRVIYKPIDVTGGKLWLKYRFD